MKSRDNQVDQYADPSAYPEIKVTGPNKHYAMILMEDYTGAVSELTAINQYIYHHFVINNYHKDIANMLENIAIVEMRHMEMLAEIIILLGGNPIYGNNYSFWNGELVYYGHSLKDQLEADLESEYKAIENYGRHIMIIQDQYIQAVLKRIILDEEVHINLLKHAFVKDNGK